ncbi:cytochrome P450 [Mycena floridula]|nr:cytochrome P450 [Mycena floridula]
MYTSVAAYLILLALALDSWLGILQMYPRRAWLEYTEWRRTYGPIMHLRVFNEHFYLNTVNSVCDRMGWSRATFGLLGYGEPWRKCRRLAQQFLKADTIDLYHPIQSRKVHDWLQALLSTPDIWAEHNRTLSASIIMTMVYGYDIISADDYYVSISQEAAAKLAAGLAPGAFAVNTFPAMKYLPSWFAFQKFAVETRKAVDAMWTSPAEFVKRNLASTLLQENEDSRFEGKRELYSEDTLRMLAVSTYGGGADTTVSSLGTFIYAMALNPRVVKKAQDELDRVIGVDCSMVWMNIWAMSHNEAVYPDPESFLPERFVKSDGSLTSDDVGYTFGFGRRICVGRHLAQATMWLAVASMLATFNIAQAKDAEGNDVPISGDYTDALIMFVAFAFPFQLEGTNQALGTLIHFLAPLLRGLKRSRL